MIEQSIKILHFTDYHGYLEGQNGIGGLAYLKSAVTEAAKVEDGVEVLTLYGGDLIGQYPLSKHFSYQPDIEILKTMRLGAFALGNHDFDDGPAVLRKIINDFNQDTEQKTAFLCANIDVTNESELADQITPYMIKRDVAIVGLITLETEKGSCAGKNVAFKDPFVTAKEIIKELQSKQIQKIIFLSHLGFVEDQKLAQMLRPYPNDFIILGGHTHTLLGKNLDPILGDSQGDYPTVVVHEDGEHKTLVTSASYHGRVLACLDLTYDAKGDIKGYSKDSIIPIDQAKVVPDKQAVAIIEKYKTLLLAKDKRYFDVVANSLAYIIGLDSFEDRGLKKLEDISRREESIACNLAADGYYHYVKDVLKEEVDLALFHAGGWRTDIAPGPIYRWQLYQAHPYPNQTLVTIKLTADQLKAVLEEGVKGIGNYHRNAQMLHGSAGFSYEFEYSDGQTPTIQNMQLNNKEIIDDISVVVNRFMIGDPNKDEHSQPYPTLFKIAKQQGSHEIAKNRPRDLEALICECEHYYGKKRLIDGALLQGRLKSNLPSLRKIHGCDADINVKGKFSLYNFLVSEQENKKEDYTEVASSSYSKVFPENVNNNVEITSVFTPEVPEARLVNKI